VNDHAPDPSWDVITFAPHQGRRGPRWLFALVGLALGLALGLAYTWYLNPVQYYDVDPVDLHPAYKEKWILAVAAAYRLDGDLDRAQSRLSGLDDSHVGQTVADLTARYIQEGRSATRVRALAALADALGARNDDMLIYLATPEPTLALPPTQTSTPTDTPTPTRTPIPTHTPTPTRTASATPTPTSTQTPTPKPTSTRHPTPTGPPPYSLDERQRICQDSPRTPYIEIVVQTREGVGLPGVEIWVSWGSDSDRFVTGLKPELGLGYADFDMVPDQTYAVAVGEPTLYVADDLRAAPCLPGEGDSPLTSWRLIVSATSAALTPTASATPTAPATSTPTPTRDFP
jgi:hypothetical protein